MVIVGIHRDPLNACAQSLEGRVSALEDEQAAKPTGPEPILTCVQCLTEYKQSENAGMLVQEL